ncbi:tRNA 2-selenouridine(34) synthase MnmH [Piscinibacter sp.]|jgi:tRNA 2-selenouridine synthase|uniref:tRNA 2-selenouridine(34) synthase MnmH n=1 Tax=Piscinibacter sp. TaxID=1903157 RepID=UPI001B4D5762|nr:tRNA 2-selenouridine(34) synthase MnmH [Piscinibacter sp.]MBK7530268.1 tRNA 2-selenouridine(34) synthase MnmH [Piscinibacter sp.]MBP6542021.1 tRNA 2-selenouridine(34) synthase MnmH [Piscinibacter sp.]HOY34161.1 tRNA 2-selenouridine(34) synthase MnmH [Piscinibacter sp.]HPG77784.1 tRNA 2-selenouridine(34) synthase MnmH [Piscinibacter sp.]
MPIVSIPAPDALLRLTEFDAVIDARSQSEYAEDRLPGAINWPTLNDAERALIGTEYKQVSPFTARKRGAVLAARNIAAHIEREGMDKPKDWTPLVYCWRGGQRSGALATVLSAIGFRVHLLEGGYREYRRAVIAALEALPQRFDFRVVCGTTGSGKSRLLQHLAESGGVQVLDLELLANHRGSVLGLVPGSPQPGQKQFESRVWDALRRFDPARPVIVESESKKVGDLRVPEKLIERMRASPCIRLELSLEGRVQLLIEDYDFFVRDTDTFCSRLDALRVLRGHEVVNGWQEAARAGRTREVVRDLLVSHYDPVYLQSMKRNFAGFAQPLLDLEWDGSADSLDAAARQVAALA